MNKKKNLAYELWRLVYPLIIYFVLQLAVSIVFLIKFTADFISAGVSEQNEFSAMVEEALNSNALLITIVSSILTLCIIVPIYFADKRKEKKLGEYVKYEKAPIIKWVLTIVFAFTSCISLNILISISGLVNYSDSYEAVNEAIYSSSFLIQFIGTVICLVEEFLVRGLIFKRMRKWTSAIPAIIVSSAIFGIIHGNLVQFVYAFVLGSFLALVYEKTKNLFVPILFHLVANFTSITIVNSEIVSNTLDQFIIAIIVMIVTTIAMVTLLVYFVKTSSVKEIETEKKAQTQEELYSQKEIQDYEEQMYNKM